MHSVKSWNWDAGRKHIVDVGTLRSEVPEEQQALFPDVRELAISQDGERIAAVVPKDEGVFGISVNGELWDGDFEKAWHLEYSPDGRLTALVRADDMWTVIVDGVRWEQEFSFAWNTKFSADGSAIAVQTKAGMDYSLAINDQPWPAGFRALRDFALSPDGARAAAVVQVEEVPEADIFKFFEGTWSVAVDGAPWERTFINCYAPVFSPDGAHVAAEVRQDICEYSLAPDGAPWGTKFTCVWEPLYLGDGSLVAPVRIDGKWSLAADGRPLWERKYGQLWNLRLAPDGEGIAAVVAPSYGAWTIAVDDAPWAARFNNAVLPPVFAPDGKRLAAAVRHDGRWSVAVDGRAWPIAADMAWDPVFSPGGERVAAKVDIGGKHAIALDGKLWSRRFQALGTPVFSPDGEYLLVKGIENDTYTREVVPIGTILG